MAATHDELARRLLSLVEEHEQPELSSDAAYSALQSIAKTRMPREEFDVLVRDLLRDQKIRLNRDNKNPALRVFDKSESLLPEKIECEKDLEPYLEGYLWRHFHDEFLNAQPQHYSLIVQNTARGGQPNGLWRRPDLTCGATIKMRGQRQSG